MTLGFDPYTVLGVPVDATGDQVAQARRRLVRKYHPDVNSAHDAAERFHDVQRAFRLLSDPAARAEYDRTYRYRGATRAADSPGRTTVAAASRFSVHPSSVNFGVLEPGNSRAYADVVVYWTAGPPPSRIWTEPGSEWWTVANTGKLALSGVVFHLRAQAPARGVTGRQHAQLTITLDGTTIAVPLTAEIGVRFSPPPSERAKSGQSTPRWLRGLGAVIWVTLGIVANVLLSHHKPGSGGVAATSASGGANASAGAASASASAHASQVDASYSAAMAEAAAQAMATPPPAKPAQVPQVREAPIKVRPAFSASGPALDKSAQSSAGLSGPPVLHGFELLVPVASKPDPAMGSPQFCVEVTVPASGGTSLAPGAAGNTYTEYPLGTVAVRGGTALAFPAALPGTYAYYPGGCSGYAPPFTLGTVTVSNLGVADGIIYIDPTNALVVYGVRTRGDTTTLTYGAIGGTASSPGPGITPPADDSCLDTYYWDTGTSAYWQPVQSKVSQRVTGTDQWLETGTMVFRGITAGSPLEFYYNCVQATPGGPPGAGSPAGLAVP